jgi:hypothetical protein
VAGIQDGVIVEAPITLQYRQAIFTSLIDLLSKTDLIYIEPVLKLPLRTRNF